jgi:hypothetical protein
MVAGLIVGLRITMTLIPRVGAKVAGAGGFLVAVAGLTLGATTTVHSPYLLAATWTALAGAGVGGGLFAGQNAALGALPKARAATGSALIQTLRQVGSVTGIAGLGALLAAVYAGQLQATDLPVPLADAVTDNVVSGVAVAQRLGSAALELQVRSAFVAAMDAALWASAAVAVVGALLVLWRLPAGRVVSDHAVDTVGDPESDRALSDVDNLRT